MRVVRRSFRRVDRGALPAFVGLALLAAACGPDDGVAVAGESTRPLRLTPAASTPPVDQTKAAVPLDEIVFDTFDGGSVPLSEATPEVIERLFDAIAPIDAPDYEAAIDAARWLEPEDLVVGYKDPEGNGWAYPVRVLNKREIVNDELGGAPVVITYCPLCGSGVVFSRRAPDPADDDGTSESALLTFSNTSALYENDMVMVDRETGSYWWQVSGESIVGSLTGAALDVLPSQTTTFESWRAQFPDTAVMVRPESGTYGPDNFGVGYASRLDSGSAPFPVSPEVFEDRRLDPSDRVIVTTIGGETRAWATAPARELTETVGGEQVTITLDGVGGAITAADGSAVPLRSAYWFAIVATDPDVIVGG